MTLDGEITAPQQRAIEALLSCETQGEAATTARVGQRSIRRWLQQAPFRAALARQRGRLLEDAGTILARGASRAAAALVAMAGGDTRATPTRVAAARAVLDTAIRAAELGEMAQRMGDIEQALADRDNQQCGGRKWD
jgi:hypothetical protein